jgi:NADH-quinone oxidoreductase subunit I
MNSFFKYFSDIFYGVKSLLTGMKVTGRYFFSPSEIVTQQYPENRKMLKMYDRFKGEVIMLHNDHNEHRCTGCGICETACPNGSIEVIQNKIDMPDGKKKRIIDKHIYHLSMCTFCGLCIKSCPSDALAWGQEFEHAVFDRSKLTKILNKPGSSILKDIAE